MATDLPGSLVIRWIAYILIFDFEIQYVPRKKHVAMDMLSRRPIIQEEIKAEEKEGDINNWPNKIMFTKGLMEFGDTLVNVTLVDIKPSPPLLEDSYSEDSIQITTYLQTLQ